MILTPPIASVIGFAAGALLFFGIGVLVGRSAAPTRKAPPSAAAAQKPRGAAGTPPIPSRDEALSRQRDQAVEKYRALLAYTARQKQKVRDAFAAVRVRVAELQRELAAAAGDRDALLESAGLQAGELRRSSLSLEALGREKEEACLALDNAREELGAARQRLGELSGVQDAHRELLARAGRLEGLLKDADTLRDENSWLRSQLAETEALKHRVDELKRENARLNAMGIVLEKPLSRSLASPLEGLGGSFQRIADRLSCLEGSRGVVLADDLGLPIAGTGDHMEAMAAMAAVFSEVSLKLESLLPFGEIDLMRISNRHRLTLSMRPCEIASAGVIVATLSAGTEPGRDEIDRLIAEAGAV